MKKLTLLLAFIGIVLSSCNGKYTIAKRKYNKGFYVSRNTGTTTKPEAVAKNIVSKAKTQEVIETEVIAKTEQSTQQVAEPITADKSVKNMESKALVSKSEAPKAPNTLLASQAPINSSEKTFKKIDHSLFNNLSTSKKGNSDANLIVLIILCFLWWLNLIAVYIHDGKSITLNFWITLLLDLTFIGGVIFSLLVVLDLVDLA